MRYWKGGRLWAATITISVCLSVPVFAAVVFSFPNFSSTAGLNLVGAAAPVSSGGQTVLRLTPAQPGQGGAVWSSTPISFANNSGGFSTYFQFQITNPGGIAPADGIVFAIQNVNSGVGGAGGSIGYGGINPSVGVEFDTFFNGENGDPNSNHVGVDINGTMVSSTTASPGGVANCVSPVNVANCMANGHVWSVWIDYSGTALVVAMADNSATRPATNLLTYTINIPCVLAGGTANGTGCPSPATSAFAGFTAGTGAGYENQDLLNWIYSNSFNPINSGATPSVPALSPLAMGVLGLLLAAMSLMFLRKRAA